MIIDVPVFGDKLSAFSEILEKNLILVKTLKHIYTRSKKYVNIYRKNDTFLDTSTENVKVIMCIIISNSFIFPSKQIFS